MKKVYLMSKQEKIDQNKGEFWAGIVGLVFILKVLYTFIH